MTNRNKLFIPLLCGALTIGLNSCGLAQWAVLSDPNTDNTTRGALVGATSGASTGAWIGSIAGRGYPGDRALAGGAIGAVVGGLAGAAIGNSMDQSKKAAARTQSERYSYASAQSGDELYDEAPQRLYPEEKGSSLYFGEKSYTLSRSAQRQLGQVAQRLKADPTAVAEIYGHTDNRGSRTQLKRISTQRAQAVRDYLMSQGVSGRQIYVQACADQYPVASNNSSAGRARNRRVEVRVTHNQHADAPAPAALPQQDAAVLESSSLRQQPASTGTRSTVGDGAPAATPLPDDQ